MTREFGIILDKYVPEFAEEVKLQLPKLKKRKMKKYTKTEKKNLFFKEDLTTPNINSCK